MLKRDFLLNEIEKLARVLARIIGLKEEGKNAEAMLLVEEELKNNFHRSAAELALVPFEELAREFPSDGSRAERANALGELLFYYAELQWEEGNVSTARASYERTRFLWDHAEQFSKAISFNRAAQRQRLSERMA